MPLKWKVNVVEELINKGYNTNRIRKERLLSESTLTKLRHNQGVSWENIETICSLLKCDISDLLEYTKQE